jgi:hypothetical protein
VTGVLTCALPIFTVEEIQETEEITIEVTEEVTEEITPESENHSDETK